MSSEKQQMEEAAMNARDPDKDALFQFLTTFAIVAHRGDETRVLALLESEADRINRVLQTAGAQSVKDIRSAARLIWHRSVKGDIEGALALREQWTVRDWALVCQYVVEQEGIRVGWAAPRDA